MGKISKKKKLVRSMTILEKGAKPTSTHSSKVIIYAFLFAFAALIINVFFIPDRVLIREAESESFYFFIIGVIGAFIVFLGIVAQNNEKYRQPIKYVFIVTFCLTILFSIFGNEKIITASDAFYLELKLFHAYLTAPLATIGFMLIYIFRTNLTEKINNLFPDKNNNNEIVTELPKSNSITNPLRKIGTPGQIFLVAIVGISLFTHFYKLDGFDLYSDEAQVTQGAAGFYHTGEFKQWSFTQEKTVGKGYDRAWPHLFLIAQSYKIFGLTPWASRFPSVLFGLIFIISSFFISYYFFRDQMVAIITSLSFSMYFYYLQLFRWARMYAIVISLFLLAFYFGYKFLSESNKLKFLSIIKTKKLGRYFDFNYTYLLPLLILIYLSFHLHVNSLLVLLILFIASIIFYFKSREVKYITAIVVGIVFIFLGYSILPNVGGIVNYLSFFEQNNTKSYAPLLFGYPFSQYTSTILLVTGTGLYFFINNSRLKNVLIFFYTSVIITWLLYAYIFNYPVSFRYLSFMAGISIMLVLFVFVILLKSIYNITIQVTGYLLVTILILLHFIINYDNLYEKNPISPSYPSIAIKTIVKNQRKGDLIYRHWGPGLYYRGIDKSVIIKDLGNYKGKPFKQILDTLNNYKSGWLTWMSHNTFRMEPKLVDYCNLYFTKYHGYGIDKTGVELFYYTDSMLTDTNIFNLERRLPFANINIGNPFSIAFWIKFSSSNTQAPFLANNKKSKGLEIKQQNSQNISLTFKYQNQSFDSIAVTNLLPDKWYHICLCQDGAKTGNRHGVYVNGTKLNTGTFKSSVEGLVKFKLNPNFVGERKDIRMYNFPLNEMQVKEIIKNLNNPISAELKANNKKFKTLYHWRKN